MNLHHRQNQLKNFNQETKDINQEMNAFKGLKDLQILVRMNAFSDQIEIGTEIEIEIESGGEGAVEAKRETSGGGVRYRGVMGHQVMNRAEEV